MDDTLVEVLHCCQCGAVMFYSDDDGLFCETDGEPCPECATICWVSVDDSEELADTGSDFETADVGQPRCNGTCRNAELGANERGLPCMINDRGCPLAHSFGNLARVDVELEPAGASEDDHA